LSSADPLPRFTWSEPEPRPLVLLCEVLVRTPAAVEDVRADARRRLGELPADA
jgi:hypothetical protein